MLRFSKISVIMQALSGVVWSKHVVLGWNLTSPQRSTCLNLMDRAWNILYCRQPQHFPPVDSGENFSISNINFSLGSTTIVCVTLSCQFRMFRQVHFKVYFPPDVCQPTAKMTIISNLIMLCGGMSQGAWCYLCTQCSGLWNDNSPTWTDKRKKMDDSHNVCLQLFWRDMPISSISS